MTQRANILGDPRAEHDKSMLDTAFLETADYRTLLETSGDRCIVVGRRGTGKSALAYKLKVHWRGVPKTKVASLSPDEDQMIGLRGSARYFGEEFKLLRAGSRVIWKYAFLMEAVGLLIYEQKSSKAKNYALWNDHYKTWIKSRQGVVDRVRNTLRDNVDVSQSIEERVGDLAGRLRIRDLEDFLIDLIDQTKSKVFVIIDRLDEGYEPDDTGVAIVDGISQAAIDLNSRIEGFRCLVFIRDNIYRTLAKKDPDFSRNIEGQTLRLHWDESSLFNMSVARLKSAFDLDQESSSKIWNFCVARGLEGRDGFRKCLRLTLYRPRDLLTLLNEAFYTARKSDRSKIIDSDVESTAKRISENRLDDLRKEYEVIVPGIYNFISAFRNSDPEVTINTIFPRFSRILGETHEDIAVSQQMAFFEGEMDIVRSLYSVGFLGVKDSESGNFVFCHDGRQPDQEFSESSRLLVHPCYWMALNMSRNALNQEEAEEIFDEYDIEVSSDNPEQRKARIGQIESQLSRIVEGQEGAAEFEEWCFQALSVVFAGALSNFDKKPNGSKKNRRDIVATNLKKTDAWSRIRDDYGVTQVVFEVKNYRNMRGDEYRQVLSYLSGEYGRLGFLVCRDAEVTLRKGHDLEWMKEVYNSHKIMVVKLTAKWLVSMLHKLRNPQKHNHPDKALNGLLDVYQRNYL